MKGILFLVIAMLFTVNAISQSDTTTATSSEYGWFQTDTKTWRFILGPDTLSGVNEPDTFIVDGDTILTDYPDTLIINFPHNLGNYFIANLTMTTDTISGEDALAGTYKVLTGPCADCYFDAGTGPSGNIPADGTPEQDDGTILDIKMRLRIIATGGMGILNTWITLKPY